MINAEKIPKFLIGYNEETRIKNNEDIEKYIELSERVGEDLISELFELVGYEDSFDNFLKECESRLIFFRNYHVESNNNCKYKYNEMYKFIIDLLGIKDEFSILDFGDWQHLKKILEKLDIALVSKDSEFEMLFYYGSLEFEESHYDEMAKMESKEWLKWSWLSDKKSAKDKFDRKFHIFNTLKSRCVVRCMDSEGESGNFKVSMRKVFKI